MDFRAIRATIGRGSRRFAGPLSVLVLGAVLTLSAAFLPGGGSIPKSGAAAPGEAPTVQQAVSPDSVANAPQQDDARVAYASLPLSFEHNVGQTDPQVDFLARGSGYTLFLTPTEAVLSLRQGTKAAGQGPMQDASSHPEPGPGAVLRMQLAGGNPNAAVAGSEAFAARVNYFLGNDPAAWRTDVPTYARVQYQDVYPGIDLAYYGAQRQLEYDFLVAPGADPAAIALRFEGANSLEVDGNGDLLLHTAGGTILQRKPVIYQEMNGVRQMVAGGYALTGERQVGFALGAYDPTLPLTIDPVLVYSTYLGGEGADWGYDIAVDGSGNAYVTGCTMSATFPTTASTYDTTYSSGGNCNAFVAQFNPALSSLLYSTYFGGSFTIGYGIAVDASGNVYVTGSTEKSLPTTPGAYQTTPFGSLRDAFVLKLDPAAAGAAQIVYCTYLTGTSSGGLGTEGRAIAVDRNGNVYVTGETFTATFPTTAAAYDTTFNGDMDAFVAVLNPALSGTAQLVYSTYLGGEAADWGNSIAVDGSGKAYVTGWTSSASFPTTLLGANGGSYDAFVAKLNPGLSGAASLVYSTYLGGEAADRGTGIAVDDSGNAYVTGTTYSGNFPTTASAYDTTYTGSYGNAFVAKLNPDPSLLGAASLVYATYLGGNGPDSGTGIALDGCGNVYVTGNTQSVNFPTTAGAYQTTLDGYQDAFVAKLDSSLSQLVYVTFLGGSGSENHNFGGGWRIGIAVDGSGNVYVTGTTDSPDFPTTTGAYETTYSGGNAGYSSSGDAFVVKLGLNSCLGSITIVKDAQPNDAQDFSFLYGNSITGGSFALDDDADAAGADVINSNQKVLTGLLPSRWTIEEFEDEPVEGWTLTSISCTPSAGTTVGPTVGTGIVVVDLAAGDDVTCTFTNTKLGSITIVKDAQPNDAQDFSFSATAGIPPFSLDDDAGASGADTALPNQMMFSSLLPGGYTFTEGLAQTGASLIQNGSFEIGPPVPGGVVNFSTGYGGITGWTVTNGTIGYVDWYWVPSDGTHALHLGSSPSAIGQSFATVAAQQYVVSFDLAGAPAPYPPVKSLQVTAGPLVGPPTTTQDYTFDVTGADPSHMGWQHKEFVFTASSSTTTLTFTSTTASLSLPGIGEFSSGPAIDNVAVRVAPGWSLANITCYPSTGTTVDTANRAVTVDLAAGADVTCTFINGKDAEAVTPLFGNIVIVKNAVPPSAQDFTFHGVAVVGGGPLGTGTWTLTDTTSGLAPNSFNSISHQVTSGIYSVSEDPVSGWTQTSATCDNGNPVNAIQAPSGVTVTCTFTNTILSAPAPTHTPTPTPTPVAVPGVSGPGLGVMAAALLAVGLVFVWRTRRAAVRQ